MLQPREFPLFWGLVIPFHKLRTTMRDSFGAGIVNPNGSLGLRPFPEVWGMLPFRMGGRRWATIESRGWKGINAAISCGGFSAISTR